MTDAGSAFDWDACWAGDIAGYDSWSYEFGAKLATTFSQLFDDIGPPKTVASVGCGPATTLLNLAEEYPEHHFYGYDISPQAIEQARKRRNDRGIENVTFTVDRLPRLSTDRSFQFVYSIATLHYVAESEMAVRSLWQCVEPEGYLAVNYPTPFHEQEMMPKLVENWDEVGFESKSQQWVRNRFRLILNGENILTEERIGALLERPPRDIRTFDAEMPSEIGEKFRVTILRK